jgi:hypothetical protein
MFAPAIALLSVLPFLLVPVQTAPPPTPPHTPVDSVRAYTFYATPALYRQLKDTLTKNAAYHIYPGGHAYVLGYVNKRWYVVSTTFEKGALRYYIHHRDLSREVRPYDPSKGGWGE